MKEDALQLSCLCIHERYQHSEIAAAAEEIASRGPSMELCSRTADTMLHDQTGQMEPNTHFLSTECCQKGMLILQVGPTTP